MYYVLTVSIAEYGAFLEAINKFDDILIKDVDFSVTKNELVNVTLLVPDPINLFYLGRWTEVMRETLKLQELDKKEMERLAEPYKRIR